MKSPQDEEEQQRAKGGQLSTLMGVFVPVMLSVYGVILFIRLGWVTGQVRELMYTHARAHA